MTLQEIKDKYEYGLRRAGLLELISVSPDTKVCMKLRQPYVDSRPIMTAREALKFSDDLEASNFKDGSIGEMWIID